MYVLPLDPVPKYANSTETSKLDAAECAVSAINFQTVVNYNIKFKPTFHQQRKCKLEFEIQSLQKH
jgi:hypothetical protein